MQSEPIFTDLVGVMAVITMIPVFFVWLGTPLDRAEHAIRDSLRGR